MIQYFAKDGTVVLADVEFTTPDMEARMIAGAAPDSATALRLAFETARRDEQRMLAAATDAQKAIPHGAYVRRWYVAPMAPRPLLVWGQVWPLEELAARERASYPEDITDADAAAAIAPVLDTMRQGYERGWRYGEWFSEVEVEGELGAAHIATLEQVTAEEFEAARARAWTQ